MAGSVLNGLSSVSALALAQPEAIATLVTLGVVATGTIVEITYKAWEHYEEKKHKQKMEAINKLHNKHLKTIIIPGGPAIPALPQIFLFHTDTKKVDSLHYNEDEIEKIGTVVPDAPVVLTRYRQHILDAILKLKAYYLEEAQDDEITTGILSYLMNILENRCLSFVGYDYDIAYLHALINFINAYASQENTEKTEAFDRLKPVYTSLMYAVQNLERHKDSMSLQDLVDQTRNISLDESNKLIRLFVKMVVPEKYQDIADTVTHEELSKDILREKYIDEAKWGIIFKTHYKINLPQSIFHNWIMGLAKYYLQSLNPRCILSGEKISLPTELFRFTDWTKTLPLHPLKQDKKILEGNLDLIANVFKHSPNFINSKLAKNEKEFVVLNTDNELIEATETMAKFAHLIHGITSLQALCAELSNSLQQLGLDFFDIEQMVANLEQLDKALEEKITRINEERNHDPQSPHYQMIYNCLKELQIKSIAMLKEKKPGPDRINKAQNTYKLTVSLFKDIIDLFSLAPEPHAQSTHPFLEKIQLQLHMIENCAFIDRHENNFSKFIAENFGFFHTNTRNKLSALENACIALEAKIKVDVGI